MQGLPGKDVLLKDAYVTATYFCALIAHDFSLEIYITHVSDWKQSPIQHDPAVA